MSLSRSLHTQAQHSSLGSTLQRKMKPTPAAFGNCWAENGVSLCLPEASSLPNIDFESDCFQLEALEELGQNTISLNNTISPTGHTSTTTSEGGASAFTPVTAGVGISAFFPVAVGGNNPTSPGLPTFFTNANTTTLAANNFPLAQIFPVNHGTHV
jgi:hypothetical protein